MMVRRTCRWQSLGALKRFHGLMVVKGALDSSPLISRSLLLPSLHLYFLHRSSSVMEYALRVFGQIAEPNLSTWNAIIRATAHSSTPSLAITHFNQMMNVSSSRPDGFTFLFLLKACVKLSSRPAGSQLHGMIVKLGLEPDAFVRNALINLHARCGDLCVARALFEDDEAAQKDVVARTSLVAGYAKRGQLDVASCLFDEAASVCCGDTVLWNTMITAYASHGRMEDARRIFEQAPHRDVVSWNAMISGYARCGFHAKALGVYQEMGNVGMDADEFTVMSLLASCADCGDLEVGQRIHRSLVSFSGTMGLLHGNAVIDMYAKCGSIDRALEVFKDMRERDVWTWNSIIGGLAASSPRTC
ncbi:uncharacterized protein A4U43_C08F22490 [Asparagus officinalis]|nr:uncharacterized protein A4U43_C08F22490 [Asparagus officinalis]